jgi:hypothetical protein
MSIVGLFFFLGWLAAGFFLTRLFLRWFLGPLYEAFMVSRKPTQYSIGDMYLLIGQIAVATLPVALVPMSDSKRVQTFVAVALFLGLSWFLCCRMLARNRIKSFKARLVAMPLFHLQLAAAIFYGAGMLIFFLLIFLSPPLFLGLAFVYAVLFAIFSHVSWWLYNQREKDSKSLTQLAESVQLSGDVLSETQLSETQPEKKVLTPPDVHF